MQGTESRRVVINGQASEYLTMKSDVPQGSVLFLMYINDINDRLCCKISILTEDTKLQTDMHKLMFSISEATMRRQAFELLKVNEEGD